MIRRSNLLILFIAFISLFSVSYAYSKTAEQVLQEQSKPFVGDWEGEERFANGWSAWSIDVPASNVYVRSAVYLQVDSWGDRKWQPVNTTAKNLCTPEESNCYVVKPDGIKYKQVDCTEHVSCERQGGKDSCAGHDYSCSGCSGWTNYDTSDYRGCTSGYDGGGYCNLSNCSTGNSKPCYGMWIYASYDVPDTCDEWDGTYYYQTNIFKKSSKSNWKKSLQEAGGYAKKIYIYSYPERVFINFNGSVHTGLCTSWASGSNDVNSNTSIKYDKGNPVCSTNITSGNMADSYISYYPNQTGGKYDLPTNQFYKIGYDFKGWVLDKNKLNSDGSLKSGQTIDFADKAILSNGGRVDFGYPAAGTYVTLYAVWQKHDYKITYTYYCGNGNNMTKIYNYGTGLDLTLQNNKLNVAAGQKDSTHEACNTDSKSYYDYSKSNTVFEGWFTDPDYINRITNIPADWYTDITIYAKLMQKRYYNYIDNRWEYTPLQ